MKNIKNMIVYLLLLLTSVSFANYKLTVNFSSMSPHIGQMLQLRVVDLDNGLEVGRKTLDAIPEASFSIDLWVLVKSHDYKISFYADFNNNKSYDVPPVDHAWELMVSNVQDDVQLDFTHNINFVEIEFPDVVPLLDLVDEWEGVWDNPTYDVNGSATAMVEMQDNNKTAVLTLTAWGIFGDPNPVSYTLTGSVNDAGDSVVFTASDPWQGSIIVSNGEINGTIAYQSIGITAEVKGNYGPDQFIVYYHMTGAFDAHEYGVLTRDVELNTLVRNNSKNVDHYQLSDNYPNPFNPSTVFTYSLPNQSDVTMTIFNQLGQMVTQIHFINQQEGQYSWSWYGDDLYGNKQPSGLYFLQFKAHDQNGMEFNKVKKMTLLK